MEKSAKSKKEVKDDKLKDQKLEDQLLNELSGNGPEEKLKLLLGKHIESERQTRRLKQELKMQEKAKENLQREKENLQREYNKSVLMRDKLQEVCREQQKIIKSMKNESLAKLREEEERRKENQVKFQASLNEINESLSKNNEENMKLRDHNIEMTKKLKFLAEQYRAREQQLEKLNEQVQLETQLQQAKFSKCQVEAAMEKEILIKEKAIALERLCQTQKVIKDLTEREQALKEQLHLYTSKYDDFQSSLQKSNDIFANYKVELEKMSKNTKKLEKESFEWKRKYERSNATLICLATEKKERDEHAARCTKQVEQLQKLLRALQHERNNLYKVLRENNIECPALPALPPEPEPLKLNPTTNTAAEAKEQEDKEKMDMMTKNCNEIKQRLASLQTQIISLKNQENETASPTPSSSSSSQQQQQKQQQEDALKRPNNKKKKQKSKNNKNKNENLQEIAKVEDKIDEVEAVVEKTAAEIVETAVEVEQTIKEESTIDAGTAPAAVAAADLTNGNADAEVEVAVENESASVKNSSSEAAEMLSNGDNSQPSTPESVKVVKLLADAMNESPPTSPATNENEAQQQPESAAQVQTLETAATT